MAVDCQDLLRFRLFQPGVFRILDAGFSTGPAAVVSCGQLDLIGNLIVYGPSHVRIQLGFSGFLMEDFSGMDSCSARILLQFQLQGLITLNLGFSVRDFSGFSIRIF